ncbi:MAG TPA: SCP2 sterol-binding domain-containing protein [Flavipsychrobacter sp.]|nr:SCP2 sterol-binding domain-containing protein [Flavipsychrobacter sp.]
MTARDIIEVQMPVALRKRPELVGEIGAVIHWEIGGAGVWTMDLTKEGDWIVEGRVGVAALTVCMSEGDFVRLRKGELSGAKAMMTGRLSFRPMNLGLAMKVARLLG